MYACTMGNAKAARKRSTRNQNAVCAKCNRAAVPLNRGMAARVLNCVQPVQTCAKGKRCGVGKRCVVCGVKVAVVGGGWVVRGGVWCGCVCGWRRCSEVVVCGGSA